MRRGGALAFFVVDAHKFLIEILNNQLEEILFGELFLLTLILLSMNNTNHTFLLSTIDSQHGFKPRTLRHISSWGNGKIISHFKLICGAHVIFLHFCHTFPHAGSNLFAFKRPPLFQLLSNIFAGSNVGLQPAAMTCWRVSNVPLVPLFYALGQQLKGYR